MNDFTKDSIKYSVTLLVICIVSGLLLGPIYKTTEPIISKISVEENKKALQELFPDAKKFELMTLSRGQITMAKSEKNNVLGFAYKVKARGYGGQIIILAGIDNQGVLKGIRVINHSETPGLGGRITEIKNDKFIWDIFLVTFEKEETIPWFQKQFEGASIHGLRLAKNKNQTGNDFIQGITGATITSQAVIRSVKSVGEQITQEVNEKDLLNTEVPKELFKKWRNQGINPGEATEYFE